MEQLERDPEFVKRRAQGEESRLRRIAETNEAAAPVVEALRAKGLSISSIGELDQFKSFPKNVPVIPILLEHIRRPYPKDVRWIIASALAVPEAIRFWYDLVELFRSEKEHVVKDSLANVLAAAATDTVIGDVISLARDREQGQSRILLLRTLEKSRDRRALQALMELGSDPELNREIQIILRRLRSRRSRYSKSLLKEFGELRNADETSMNFDAQDLVAFLKRIKSLITSGFGDEEVHKIQVAMDGMDVGDETELEFAIQYHGTKSSLIVSLAMSDIDAPM